MQLKRWKETFKCMRMKRKKYDCFDYLPDELLCTIFNRLDYRTLTLYVSTLLLPF